MQEIAQRVQSTHIMKRKKMPKHQVTVRIPSVLERTQLRISIVVASRYSLV